MTELQRAADDIKKSLQAFCNAVENLRAEQEKIKKPKVPKFPFRFIAIEDCAMEGEYTIGLEYPINWEALPRNFKGRACFSTTDIRQIITGLQTLLGEQQ